ncbi:LysR family transcriptional regulator [Labrenzia sp. PHM005]|nr:LysR family transcriptional regulator [Labrenzia sp. PHM005]
MLRCFAAVAQSGNLADAGLRLGRTPSAISMSLKQMEDHLGARLFETDRKNELTPFGEEVFTLAQQQLRLHDEAIDTIETLARSPGGVLRIASVPSAVPQGLSKSVGVMMARYPSLQIEIRDADSDIVTGAIMHGQVEVGIVSGQPKLNGICAEPLFEDTFGLVAAPDHSLMHCTRAPDLDELMIPGFVHNHLCSKIQIPAVQKLLQTKRVTARNTLSLISMVQTGNWFTILPESVVGLLPSHLAFRKIRGLDEKRVVSLLTRERCLFPDLVKEFATVLRAQASTNFASGCYVAGSS